LDPNAPETLSGKIHEFMNFAASTKPSASTSAAKRSRVAKRGGAARQCRLADRACQLHVARRCKHRWRCSRASPAVAWASEWSRRLHARVLITRCPVPS